MPSEPLVDLLLDAGPLAVQDVDHRGGLFVAALAELLAGALDQDLGAAGQVRHQLGDVAGGVRSEVLAGGLGDAA